MQKIERLISTVDVMYFKHVCVYCIRIVGTGCRVEMTTQQSNNNTIYFRCSVVQ